MQSLRLQKCFGRAFSTFFHKNQIIQLEKRQIILENRLKFNDVKDEYFRKCSEISSLRALWKEVEGDRLTYYFLHEFGNYEQRVNVLKKANEDKIFRDLRDSLDLYTNKVCISVFEPTDQGECIIYPQGYLLAIQELQELQLNNKLFFQSDEFNKAIKGLKEKYKESQSDLMTVLVSMFGDVSKIYILWNHWNYQSFEEAIRSSKEIKEWTELLQSAVYFRTCILENARPLTEGPLLKLTQ